MMPHGRYDCFPVWCETFLMRCRTKITRRRAKVVCLPPLIVLTFLRPDRNVLPGHRIGSPGRFRPFHPSRPPTGGQIGNA
ncbi:hypothetical protein Mal65_42330 [Crateriforma conspicua]|nr:hypothetical protein Mal65_42330 [Crateriforma conspicua]